MQLKGVKSALRTDKQGTLAFHQVHHMDAAIAVNG